MKLTAAIAILSLGLSAVSTPASAALIRGGNNGNGQGNGNNGNGNNGNGNNEPDGDGIDTSVTPPTADNDHSSPLPPIDEGGLDPAVDTRATAELLGLSLDDAKLLMEQQEEFR